MRTAEVGGPFRNELLGADDQRIVTFRTRLCGLALGSAAFLDAGKAISYNALAMVPAVTSVVGALLVISGRRTVGLILFALTSLWKVGVSFPLTPNHSFMIAFGLFACLWAHFSKSNYLVKPMQLVRWLGFSMLFGAGAQKLLHAEYWNGAYLAVRLASEEPRWYYLGRIVSGEELAQLTDPEFNGPYVLTTSTALAISRFIPLAEIALAVGMLLKRSRDVAVGLGIFFIIGLQMLAGEVTFALGALGVLSSFLPIRMAVNLTKVLWFAASGAVLAANAAPGVIN